MKTTKLVLATVFLTGLATFAFAGPSPQFWNQQELNRKANSQAKEQSVAQAKSQCAGSTICANCSCAAMKKS